MAAIWLTVTIQPKGGKGTGVTKTNSNISSSLGIVLSRPGQARSTDLSVDSKTVRSRDVRNIVRSFLKGHPGSEKIGEGGGGGGLGKG